LFDWDDLRFFAVLAEEGSLAATGRRLGVDHVTVARRVAALEAKTGLKLVDRRQKRTELTAAGLRVADHARRMQDEAFSLERTLLMSRSELSGDVSVSLPSSLASELVAPKLAEFLGSHPGLRLTIMGEARNVSLSRREADIAMRLVRPGGEALIARKVGTIRYRLFASQAYLSNVPVEERRYILFDLPLQDLPQQKWLYSIIPGDLVVVLRSNELAIQAAAAAAGAGIAILPDFLGAREGLVDADELRRHFDREVWLTWHEDLRGQPAISAVAEFLSSCVPRTSR
jgi:DNA-binding transcriptional LysR family regulator